MTSLNNQAGISISENKIQIVELKYISNNFFLENIDEEYFEDNADFSDEEQFIPILQKSFEKLTSRKSLNANSVSITLPPDFFLSVSFPIDTQLTQTDLTKHINWELKILYPTINPEDYTFRNLNSKIQTGSLFKKSIFLGAKKNFLKKLHQFSIKNNLALKFVDSSNIVSHALLSKNQELRSKNISLYKSGRYITITIGDEFELVFLQTIEYQDSEEFYTKVFELCSKTAEGYGISDLNKIYFFSNENNDAAFDKMTPFFNGRLKTANFLENFKNKIKFETNIILNDDHNSYFSAASIALRQI